MAPKISDGRLPLRLDNASHLPASEGVALDYLRLGWRPIVGRDRRVLGVRIEIGAMPSTTEATSNSTLGAVIAALADQATTSAARIDRLRTGARLRSNTDLTDDRRHGTRSPPARVA